MKQKEQEAKDLKLDDAPQQEDSPTSKSSQIGKSQIDNKKKIKKT